MCGWSVFLPGKFQMRGVEGAISKTKTTFRCFDALSRPVQQDNKDMYKY